MSQIFLMRIQGIFLLTIIVSMAAPICHAELSCGSGDKQTFIDFNYCQLSSQLGKPARWIDGVFIDPNQASVQTSHSQYHITNSTHFSPVEETYNETLIRAQWQLPNLEDRFLIQFSSLTDSDLSRLNSAEPPAINNKGTSLAAKIKSNFGSVRLGLRYTDQLVLTTQATLPRALKIKNNNLGMLHRLSWSTDQFWRGFSLFYWDNYLNSKWTTGLDTRWLYQFSTESGVNLSTYTVRRKGLHWEAVMLQGQEILFSSSSNEINYWSSLALSRPIGRDWAKFQLIPAVFWREEQNYKMAPRLTLNFIINLVD